MSLSEGFQMPFGIQPTIPTPVDTWSGPYSGFTREIAITDALNSIPQDIRFPTMEVRVVTPDGGEKWWFKYGISDPDLVFFGVSVISFNDEVASRVSGDTRLEQMITGLTVSIPTSTSGFTNNGSDGINPYISLVDIPPQTFQSNIVVSLSGGKTLGRYGNGETIPSSGKTAEEVFRLVGIEDVYPTYVLPTISLVDNIVDYVEVGATGTTTITSTFTKNDAGNLQIIKILSGSTVQLISGTTSPLSYNGDIKWVEGTNTFNSNCSYLSGTTKIITGNTRPDDRAPQILSVNAPQAANTNFSSNSTTTTGIYPVFYLKSISPITSTDMSNAISGGTTNGKLIISSTNTISIPYAPNQEYFAVAYPYTSTTKTRWYVTDLSQGDIPGGVFGVVDDSKYINSFSGYWSNIRYKIHVTPLLTNTSAATIQLRNN